MKYSYKNTYSIHIQHGKPSFEMYGTLNHIICICVNILQDDDYQYVFSQDITDFIRNNKDYDIITNTSIFIIINELLKLQASLLDFRYQKKRKNSNKKILHLMKEISYLILFYRLRLDNYSLIEDT